MNTTKLRDKFKSRHKAILKAMLFVGLMVLCMGGYYAYLLYLNPNIRVTDADGAFLYIRRGDTLDDVCNNLNATGCVKNIESFRQLAVFEGYEGDAIRPGRYRLRDKENNKKLLHYLSHGYQTPTKITFNNIRTREQLAGRLGRQLMIDSTEILAALSDTTLLSSMGMEPETAVCLFIPNTYEVYWTISPDDLLRRMAKEYGKFWNKKRMTKAQRLGMTPTEVQILASIVEEETTKQSEKPRVAGLYINRLRIDMALQSDPTVRFATGRWDAQRVLHDDIAVDSPYNTYLHNGLPPGPIRLPSIADIDAVLNYEQHDYLYMCAREDFSGYHNFAKSFTAHKANAEKYRSALNKRRIFE